jgi:branched-chain amino acid aminotransferase
VLKTQLNAKKQGYADVIYLDAVENKYVEEVSSCNIFVVKVRVLNTSCTSSLAVAGLVAVCCFYSTFGNV